MKTLLIFLISFSVLSGIQASAQGTLHVTVRNLKSDQGTIRLGLFKEGKFLKEAAFGKIVKAAKGAVVIELTNLPTGEYALSVIHDENANEELDTNVVGIPKEGFAFGNNSMGFFGPPSFKEAKFQITAGDRTIQVIDIRYL